MALFGQQQHSSNVPHQNAFHGFCSTNQFAAFSSKMSSSPNYSSRKRHSNSNIMDEPLEKKRFEQISDDFTNFSLNSPQIQEIYYDENAIEEDWPTTSDAIEEDETEPFVEEPEEGGQLVLSDELANYLDRFKTDSIKSRIVEIEDDDEEEDHQQHSEENGEQQPTIESNISSPISLPNNDGEEQMEID